MTDDSLTQPPTAAAPVEPEASDAAPDPLEAPPPAAVEEEDVPLWLQRLRARRAAELAAREGGAIPLPVAAPKPRPKSPPETPPETAPGPEVSPGPAPPDGEPAWLKDATDGGAPPDEGRPPGETPDHPPDHPPDRPPDHPPDAPSWLVEVIEAQRAAEEAAEDEDAAPTESLRQRRARRHRARQVRRRGGDSVLGSVILSLVVVVVAAVMVATIFTFWTPVDFLSDQIREGLRPAYATLSSAGAAPTLVPTPIWMRRVGIVSGHRGPHPSTGRGDPGAVCPDGLTEAEINFTVARLVVAELSGRGYNVDLIDEWDPRLTDYQASALVSIHADSCYEFEIPGATGFKVAPPVARLAGGGTTHNDERLTNCLIERYGQITGLPLHPSVTRDMTEYHSFGEISPLTPAAIIEVGFMFEDREILTQHPDLLAEGIVEGLLCFLEAPPPTPLPELTPWPTALATPTPLETPGPS